MKHISSDVTTGKLTETPHNSDELALKAVNDVAGAAAESTVKWEKEMAAIDAEGVDRFREEMIDSMIAGGLTINSFWLDIHTRKKAKRAAKP